MRSPPPPPWSESDSVRSMAFGVSSVARLKIVGRAGTEEDLRRRLGDITPSSTVEAMGGESVTARRLPKDLADGKGSSGRGLSSSADWTSCSMPALAAFRHSACRMSSSDSFSKEP